jgi:ABC-type bacteriocin/lantibiotic exporter with double-glycine peptidase domain
MKYIHTKQHGKYDCGLACISSILKFYGYNYGINYLTDFTVVKKGYNLKDLLSVLRNFEFLTYKPVEVDKNRLDIVFDNISTPCIALVNENNEGHYIVIYKKKRGKLIISDPKNKQITAIKMGIITFQKSFSGVLLMIEPCCLVQNKSTESSNDFVHR